MGKKRVHEVAKDIGLESKELLRALAEVGVNVKNVLSTLEDHEIILVTRHVKAEHQKPGGVQADKARRNIPPRENTKVVTDSSSASRTTPASGHFSPSSSVSSPKTRPPRLSQFGPGLVDRVPQRPPDRRFLERPLNIPGNLQTSVHTERQATVPSSRIEQTTRPIAGQVAERTPAPPVVDQVSSATTEDRGVSQRVSRPERREPLERSLDNHPRSTNQVSNPSPRRNTYPPQSADGTRLHASGARPPQPAARPRPPQGPRVQGGPRSQSSPHRPAGTSRPQGGPRPQGGGGARPSFGGSRPQFTGERPTGGVRPGSPRPGSPRPGGTRPGASRPGGRRPALDLNRAIPKPPAEVVDAGRPDKGAAQQRLAANRDKNRGQRRWDASRKKAHNEDKIIRTRPRSQVDRRIPVEKKTIILSNSLTIKELAEKMSIKAADVIKRLMQLGTMATINQEIDIETAGVVAQEFGFPVEIKTETDIEAQQLENEAADDPSTLMPRPPVVVVMGHVDHGKTSLLDAIRHTNVTATEHGGITQHIGAYQIRHNGKGITFLDTPGHEAFTAMRARGAHVTDIAILVVAADDGVKPQTIEAINHARAAEIPVVVAINKMDKPEANPERVKQQLTEHGLVAEQWGGETIMVPVSATTHQGVGELLEMVLLVAEMGELKANPNRTARGTIIESCLDKGRGPVATVLVQNGTLNSGDALVAGSCFARVRAMMDYKGRRVKKAGPSTAVEVLGFSDVPVAGDTFFVTEDEKTARQTADKRHIKKRQEEFRVTGRLSLEDVFKRIQEGEVKELHLILKADVQGSVEALAQSLEQLSTDEVKVQIIHQGVGAITETDILLASASNAVIIGFNVVSDVNARRAAEREKVDVRLYQVIYDAISDVRAALSGLLEPEYREVTVGQAEVRKVFHVSKVGSIAGCYVVDGKIPRDAGLRLIRDGVVVHEGKLSSLKRFKDDVKEVAQGYECGLTLDNFNDIQDGDQIVFYVTEAIQRELQ